MRFLTAELVRVADATGEHYRPMVLTAGLVGLRIGELAGLRIDNVNLLKQNDLCKGAIRGRGKKRRDA
jgi:integrase